MRYELRDRVLLHTLTGDLPGVIVGRSFTKPAIYDVRTDEKLYLNVPEAQVKLLTKRVAA